jgi:antitoxin ParD1/3/4
MPDLSIHLSDDSQAFVQDQVAAGSFSSPSDYVASLIESARKQAAHSRVEALLIEGLESGPPIDVSPEYWRQKKEEWSRKYDRADKP